MRITKLVIAVSLTISLFNVGLRAQVNYEAPLFTPTIDGTISEAEMAGQFQSLLSWPEVLETGGSAVIAAAGIELDISADIYTSWDATNLYVSAVVADTVGGHQRFVSPGPYNGQDTLQFAFNPNNDPKNNFVVEPFVDTMEIGPAAIYDLVLDTQDEFGPDIYRHGDVITTPDLEDAGGPIWTIQGQQTFDDNNNLSGYMLEAAIPWSIAMDIDPNYSPKVGDQHGYSYLILDVDDFEDGTAEGPSLVWDAGEDCCGEGENPGANTIQVPTDWHVLTLVAPAVLGDFDADGSLTAVDIDLLSAEIQAKTNSSIFDLTGEGTVNAADHKTWIESKHIANTWFGDANLDGEFNSGDLVFVFSAGLYESNTDAGWRQGDWNADGLFNSSDFVAAFSGGGYETGPRVATAVVPEPSSIFLIGVGMLAIIRCRERQTFVMNKSRCLPS